MTEALVLTRTLPAPAERVWRAFTEPARLAAWFWPQRAGTVTAIDLRVGGRYSIDATAGGYAVTGEYQVVDPPRRLVFTWQWAGDPDTTLVTLEFTAVAAGTELTVRHERFSTPEDRDSHEQGWHDCLDRLPAELTTG